MGGLAGAGLRADRDRDQLVHTRFVLRIEPDRRRARCPHRPRRRLFGRSEPRVLGPGRRLDPGLLAEHLVRGAGDGGLGESRRLRDDGGRSHSRLRVVARCDPPVPVLEP